MNSFPIFVRKKDKTNARPPDPAHGGASISGIGPHSNAEQAEHFCLACMHYPTNPRWMQSVFFSNTL